MSVSVVGGIPRFDLCVIHKEIICDFLELSGFFCHFVVILYDILK